MAITSSIGRKSWEIRLLFLGIYAFLILGGLTMVYPFLLMISGSTKSAVDMQYFDAVPRFLYDDAWLYRKHLEGLFNEDVSQMNIAYDADITAFDFVELPAEVNDARVEAYRDFLQSGDLPFYAFDIGYLSARISRTTPSALRDFKRRLAEDFGRNIDEVNRRLQTRFTEWYSVFVLPSPTLMRRDRPGVTPFAKVLNAFRDEQPLGMRYYFSAEGLYKKMYLKPRYGLDIQGYNAAHGTHYASYDEVHLPRVYPAGAAPGEREDWEFFLRNTLALHWIRVDASAAGAYRSFLEAKHGAVSVLNRRYGTQYTAFEDAPLIEEPPLEGMALSDWEAFIVGWDDPETGLTHKAPVTSLRVHSLDFLFRDYLAERFGDLEAINAALGTAYRGLTDIALPQDELHARHFFENRRPLRWEFATRNYRTVADYLVFHGRGVVNTVIYCTLAVVCALLVNPLAAYAMSRYKLPSAYKILLFLMCTMAFPPMVTAIPNFLMLRRLGLLNTFAALILPGLANGYAIFLLKGFFDAQPQELYESAMLDGASEWTIFWQITMSLSKPVLAVIALQAFTGAYSNFMFAFVVCQDPKMWTLMVWLYQLQQRSGQAVMYASLIIAAIPTFLIFLFCQNLIMRGIVVPSEK